jgi:hypothetical protein
MVEGVLAMNKKEQGIPAAIKNYTEVQVPNAKGFKLGTKNQRKLERIRMLAKQARGAR